VESSTTGALPSFDENDSQKKRKKEERKGVLFRRRLKDYCRAIYSRGKDLSLIPETQRSASERLHFT
jgi:hypothetical protein